MKTRQQYIDILRQHAPELQSNFGIRRLRLFGSVARDEHTEKSDIDLFALMPPDYYNYARATSYLQSLLGCDVDLIRNRKNLRPFLKQQIDKYGVNIYPTT